MGQHQSSTMDGAQASTHCEDLCVPWNRCAADPLAEFQAMEDRREDRLEERPPLPRLPQAQAMLQDRPLQDVLLDFAAQGTTQRPRRPRLEGRKDIDAGSGTVDAAVPSVQTPYLEARQVSLHQVWCGASRWREARSRSCGAASGEEGSDSGRVECADVVRDLSPGDGYVGQSCQVPQAFGAEAEAGWVI